MQNPTPAGGAPSADAARPRGPEGPRARDRRARHPGHRPDDVRLRLEIAGVAHLVETCPGDPADGAARVLELTPDGGAPAVLCVEWEDGPDDGRPGYRGLTCSCGSRPAYANSCDHLRALVAFGLLRPRTPADAWGAEADAHRWVPTEAVHFQLGGAGR